MANSFPGSLNNYVTGASSVTLVTAGHAAAHNAIEAKLGIDSSAVTTSIDYLLKNTSSVNPGHHHSNVSLDSIASSKVTGLPTFPTGTIVGTTDTQVLTNKTLTTPIIATISNTGTLTLPTSTDTLVGKATTDTLTNKTIGDTLNMTTGNITQTGIAAHVTVTPGASKLVKISVLRQDDTTNTYTNSSVILTGWGYLDINSGAATGGKTVTFGITFTQKPVVVMNCVGLTTSAVADIGSFTQTVAANGQTQSFAVDSITTTTFHASGFVSTNMGATTHLGFGWIAVGTF